MQSKLNFLFLEKKPMTFEYIIRIFGNSKRTQFACWSSCSIIADNNAAVVNTKMPLFSLFVVCKYNCCCSSFFFIEFLGFFLALIEVKKIFSIEVTFPMR